MIYLELVLILALAFSTQMTMVYAWSFNSTTGDVLSSMCLLPMILYTIWMFYRIETKTSLRIRIKIAINRYKKAPIGTLFTENGPKVHPKASMHQALLVQEWIEKNPNIILDKKIWKSARMQFKHAPHAIAMTENGIEFQDQRTQNILTITKK